MTETFANLEKDDNIQKQKTQRSPIKVNPNSSLLRHMIIKSSKIKDKKRVLNVRRAKE
jgi:hypothetical protein